MDEYNLLIKNIRLSFLSSNSSFKECVRNDSPLILFHNSLSILHSNTNTVKTGIISSHQQIDLYANARYGPIYTFQSCTFVNVDSSRNGGAIACTGTPSNFWKPELVINQCSFKSCKSSLGHGGAVYTYGLSSSQFEKSVFIDCNSTNRYAGALYCYTSYCIPLVSDSTFIDCYARMCLDPDTSSDDAGAMYLRTTLSSQAPPSSTVQACRFIACHCFGWGGGAYLLSDSAKLICRSSLFSSCTSDNAEALGINLATAQAEVLVFFSFFSCASDAHAQTASDICINRQTESFSSSAVLQSFSTKSTDNAISLYLQWTSYDERNWYSQDTPQSSNQNTSIHHLYEIAFIPILYATE